MSLPELPCSSRTKLTGGDGVAGIAAASTAGNAAAVPAAIAAIDQSYAPIAPWATMLVATCIIVTSVMVPFATAWWARKVKRNPTVKKMEAGI